MIQLYRRNKSGKWLPGFVVSVLLLALVVVYGSREVMAADGAVDGYLTDEDLGGVPLSGIAVFVDDGTGTFPGDVSDASGYYNITGVAAGTRNVVAARGSSVGGTAKDDLYARAHDYLVNVVAGQTARRNFSLTKKMGSIQVTLTGEATCRAGIHVLADSTQNTAYSTGITDGSGQVTLSRIRPGSAIYVTTVASGTPPNQCNQAQVGPFTLSDGQTRNVSITQTKGGDLLYGRVQEPSGALVDGATVWVNPSAGHTGNVCNTMTGPPQASGHFACYLQPSTYDVHISNIPGYPNFIQYEVVVSGTTTKVFTLLKGNVDLEGTVRNMAGDPIVDAHVQPFKHVNPGNWGDVYTDSSGEYTVPGLTVGQYQIFCAASGYQSADTILYLVDGTNVVDFTLLKDTALLIVQPTYMFLLGEVDAASATMLSFSTSNGGAGGTADWTSASVSVTPPSPGIMTVMTPSGNEGDPVRVLADPRGKTVGQKYTGTLTVVGSGDAGTRQVTIEMLVVQDIYNAYLPAILKSYSQ